ncbi:MAG TPA: NADH-quinone oxidoreductase subunit L [Bryobacteraceae bacterium]|nr:NADH-quinone oxidoreductase subunit L [Bryobacteraceae bacterium]
MQTSTQTLLASQQLWLIPIFPFLGFLLNGIFGRRLSKPVVSAIACGTVLLSFLWVLKIIAALGAPSTLYLEHYFTWIQSGALNISADFAVDRLTEVMLLIVTGVGFLIHIYSIGYMAHEGGYYRFFAYMNLFMFFMLTLVLGANFLLLFVGWEGVGLCSYLLIGFYFLEKFATDAGNKAFIVNRIGDYGFSLAVFLIVIHFGTLDFTRVFSQVKGMPVEAAPGWITAICLLLLVGAAGKSAQIPLYVWLPDAMAGPTPVSALIHAATMVTAGVYMITRSSQLFLHSPFALNLVAIVGVATAFFAATIGLLQNDIKKVFAYSTVSQLGYMFLGLGTGAFSAGIFHLMTHAFFKALLFLGAGSVIHALSGEQDLRHMGGLAKKIPITCVTLFCAGVAIAGVPPFSGFHSKDAILSAAYDYAPWMYWVGAITAGMTAFYVFRALFLCFFGEYRGDHHPHESPAVMWIPLAALAALSLGGGYINIPQFLSPIFPLATESGNEWTMYVSVAFGLGGIALAYLFYVVAPSIPESLESGLHGLYTLIYNKYFVDELYDATVVRPVVDGSRTLLWRGADATIIDGAVNGVGRTARAIGGILKFAQNGYIRDYAGWVVAGSIAIVVYMAFYGGAR